MLAMSLLTAKSEDITPDHIADIAVLLSSCTDVISTEVPIALGKIAVCIRKCGKAEDFAKVEPADAINWLKSNCPLAAEKLLTFYDMHGHRCVQELDFIAEPWILQPNSIISTIQVSKKTRHSYSIFFIRAYSRIYTYMYDLRFRIMFIVSRWRHPSKRIT